MYLINVCKVLDNKEKYYFQSIYYSFGALIPENRRIEFDSHVKKLYSMKIFNDSLENPANLSKISIIICINKIVQFDFSIIAILIVL